MVIKIIISIYLYLCVYIYLCKRRLWGATQHRGAPAPLHLSTSQSKMGITFHALHWCIHSFLRFIFIYFYLSHAIHLFTFWTHHPLESSHRSSLIVRFHQKHCQRFAWTLAHSFNIWQISWNMLRHISKLILTYSPPSKAPSKIPPHHTSIWCQFWHQHPQCHNWVFISMVNLEKIARTAISESPLA